MAWEYKFVGWDEGGLVATFQAEQDGRTRTEKFNEECVVRCFNGFSNHGKNIPNSVFKDALEKLKLVSNSR